MAVAAVPRVAAEKSPVAVVGAGKQGAEKKVAVVVAGEATLLTSLALC